MSPMPHPIPGWVTSNFLRSRWSEKVIKWLILMPLSQISVFLTPSVERKISKKRDMTQPVYKLGHDVAASINPGPFDQSLET